MKTIIIVLITLLIFTNALTDAPNAIATLVGTRVMSFKKAAKLSALFNLIGIIFMSLVNFSVANCLSSMVYFYDGSFGYIILISSIIAVVLFSLIALIFGIPTSETHGLVAGLTGSAIAIYGIKSVNLNDWKNVIIGLFWSVFGTYIICYLIVKLFQKKFNKMTDKNIKKYQIISTCGISFMHGAQDGQKFIGVLIILECLLRNNPIVQNANPNNYLDIIIFTSIIMALGCSIGGKRIVENIGNNIVSLNIREGLFSDITTVFVLFLASLTRTSCKYNTC